MDVPRLLHLLAMAWFVGGQLLLVGAVVPALRGGEEGRERLRAVASATELQVKLGLVGLVIALVAAHLRWPRSHALDGALFAVSLAIVALGVALAH